MTGVCIGRVVRCYLRGHSALSCPSSRRSEIDVVAKVNRKTSDRGMGPAGPAIRHDYEIDPVIALFEKGSGVGTRVTSSGWEFEHTISTV